MPAPGLESLVSANIHMDTPERLLEIVQGNPLSYLHVVKPHLLSGEPKNPEVHFPLAKAALDRLIQQGSIDMDDEPGLYVYKQTRLSDGLVFLGLVCTVDVEDYFTGHIKIHEKTITEKENQLIQHIETTGVIGEPVLLTHPANKDISFMLEEYVDAIWQIKSFEDDAGVRHDIYAIRGAEAIDKLETLYLKAGDLYIADGHHRSAASAGYYRKNNIKGGKYLAFIVPPEYLKINSFHRAFKASGQFDEQQFLSALEINFSVTPVNHAFQPVREHEFGLYIGGSWYILDYKHNCNGLNAVDKLDVSLLEEYVFKSILNIQDSKTDKQLEFIKGNLPLNILEKKVQEGIFDFVFTVFPCKVEEMFDVADQSLIMPPKSTFIEPKLRTGLFIQKV